MSRKGSGLDDTPRESFFHSIEVERVHHRAHATRAEARSVRVDRGLPQRPPPPLGAGAAFTGRRRAHGDLTASAEPAQDQWNSEHQDVPTTR